MRGTLKVALIVIDLGVPRTLATSAFLSAVAEGLDRIGIPCRIVTALRWNAGGGPDWQRRWDPSFVQWPDVAAPSIEPPPPRWRDEADAVRRGILEDGRPDGDDWYHELLMERELERLARRDKDLALLVYPISYPLLSMVSRIARRRRWRLIVPTTETMSRSFIDPDTRDAYIQSVCDSADGIWAVSDFLADYWSRLGIPRERIFVHPGIVSETSFSAAAPPRSSSAAYLGNLEHQEIGYLLDIAGTVARAVPAFRLTVYADARDDIRRELEREILERGLGDTVTLSPLVPPSSVPDVLMRADVLLLPRARGEFSQAGFPNKLGQYLASGRPVVVTRVGDIPKYLVDGESAFLVEPDDCAAFAAAVVSALTERDRAHEIGARGKRVAEELLSSPAVASRLVAFIEGCSLRRPGPSPAEHMSRLTRLVSKAARDARTQQANSARLGLERLRGAVTDRVLHGHTLSDAFKRSAGAVAHRLRYARTGHTRWVAFKMLVVAILRSLHLRGPEDEG